MTAEEIRRMEERVAQVRAEMERACRAAGRAPGEVLLCAASKTQNSETVRAAAALDIDLFGENRVQELCEKYAAGAYSGKPLHFIGHLQTNKVRQVVGRACMIESVGSHRLLECVAAEAQKQGIRQDILVEINIGAETSKSGIAPEELPGLLECAHALPSLRVRGLMSIPPAADAPGASRPYFAQMRGLFERAQAAQGGNVSMEYLSMGMSADFADAILEGANLVRVGTALFGARSYPAQRYAPLLAAGKHADLLVNIISGKQKQRQHRTHPVQLQTGESVPQFVQNVFFRIQAGLVLLVIAQIDVCAEFHLPVVGPELAGDNIEQRGLAHAVRPNDGHPVASAQM